MYPHGSFPYIHVRAGFQGLGTSQRSYRLLGTYLQKMTGHSFFCGCPSWCCGEQLNSVGCMLANGLIMVPICTHRRKTQSS